MVGHCALAYVAKALQDYLREFITREAGVASSQIESVLPTQGSWLDRNARFLRDHNALSWDDSPVPKDSIKEIIRARNFIWHDLSIDSAWPRQTEKDVHEYTQKSPAPP